MTTILKEGDEMHILFLVLNETEYLDDILSAFVEVGVKGATILDSQGMASAIASNVNRQIPLFGSLKSFLDSSRPYNKTVFTVVESQELLDKAINAINGVIGDICKPGIGLMFTVPVGNVYGLPKNTK
ncbi:hypothetical protein [Alkaliphilus sp. B6464]|uniref:hypothetical protein n=1 Tax=Alkaliphilus sp. B6464 TaxID=2731219 RepID=UPI0020126194|nr:hypothetical protein [Alkaliphilus sp. B6464]